MIGYPIVLISEFKSPVQSALIRLQFDGQHAMTQQWCDLVGRL